MLSDKQISDIHREADLYFSGDTNRIWTAKAIESAATAPLLARIAELEQQLQAYEKHGVTCQTFRHFVSDPCAECNSPGRCAIKEQT